MRVIPLITNNWQTLKYNNEFKQLYTDNEISKRGSIRDLTSEFNFTTWIISRHHQLLVNFTKNSNNYTNKISKKRLNKGINELIQLYNMDDIKMSPGICEISQWITYRQKVLKERLISGLMSEFRCTSLSRLCYLH